MITSEIPQASQSSHHEHKSLVEVPLARVWQ